MEQQDSSLNTKPVVNNDNEEKRELIEPISANSSPVEPGIYEEEEDYMEQNDYQEPDGSMYNNADGSIVIVDEVGMKMYYKTDPKQEQYIEIQTSAVILPKYKFKKDDTIYFILLCKNSDESISITISAEDFDTSANIRRIFRKSGFNIGIYDQSVIYSYLNDHSKKIKNIPMEVNTVEGYISNYSFYYKQGKLVPRNDEGLYVLGDEVFHLDYDYEPEMTVFKEVQTEYYDTCPEKHDGLFVQLGKALSMTNINRFNNFIVLSFILLSMIKRDLCKFSEFSDTPLLFLFGPRGSGKSSISELIAQIMNLRIQKDITKFQIYKKCTNIINYIITIDDIPDVNEYKFYLELFREISGVGNRDRQYSGKDKHFEIADSFIVNSNRPILEPALVSRMLKLDYIHEQKGAHEAYFELKEFVKKNALGIFLDAFDMVWGINLEEIKAKMKNMHKKIKVIIPDEDRQAMLYGMLLVMGIELGIHTIVGYSSEKEIFDDISLNESNREDESSTFKDMITEFLIQYKDDPSIVRIGNEFFIQVGHFLDWNKRTLYNEKMNTKTLARLVKLNKGWIRRERHLINGIRPFWLIMEDKVIQEMIMGVVQMEQGSAQNETEKKGA